MDTTRLYDLVKIGASFLTRAVGVCRGDELDDALTLRSREERGSRLSDMVIKVERSQEDSSCTLDSQNGQDDLSAEGFSLSVACSSGE